MSESIPSLVVTSDMLSSTTSTVTPQDGTNTIQPPGDAQTLEAHNALMNFWQNQLNEVQNMSNNDFKDQYLPLARIKKIMKMDEDVKMISAEAPLLFAKAAQMFITGALPFGSFNKLSLRAWVHTEENKRRTLQRNDIATAITKFDQFDFLIDIVPREELKPTRRPMNEVKEESKAGGEAFQYLYNLPQQSSQVTSAPQTAPQTSSAQTNQVVITPQGQILQLNSATQASNGDVSPHIIQLSQPQSQQQAQTQPTESGQVMIGASQQPPTGVVVNAPTESQSNITPQLIQQLISNSGASPSDIHSIQITPDGQIQIIKVAPSASENL